MIKEYPASEHTARGRPICLRLVSCGVMLAGVFAAIACLAPGAANIPVYLLLFALAFTVYAAASALVLRRPPRSGAALIIILSALFHFILVPAAPTRSADMYRYLWDGRLVLHGINPLLHAPSEIGFRALRDRSWPQINNTEVPSVYPTISQAVFSLCGWLAPGSVTSWKAIISAFDLLTVAGLAAWLRARGQPPERCILYAWNPLPITEFALNGHQDAIGIALMVLALWIVSSQSRSTLSPARQVAAGVALAASIFAKGYSLLLVPFLWRRRSPWLTGSTVIGSLLLAVPLLHGWSRGSPVSPWTGLLEYSGRWERNDSVFRLLTAVMSLADSPAWFSPRLVLAILMIGIAVGLASRNRGETEETPRIRRALLAMGCFLLLSPVVYPWYAAWLIPLAVVTGETWPLLFAFLVALDYLHVYFGREMPVVLLAEYLPVAALCFFEWRQRVKNAHAPRRVPPRGVVPWDGNAEESRVAVVIPALNEEAAIGRVINAIPSSLGAKVIVVDNGSEDGTAAAARKAGAAVVSEPRRGYGAACLAGIAAVPPGDVVVFLDGDLSDDPSEMPGILAPIFAGEADLVIGSRMLGRREPGALPAHAIFGNWLSALLLRILYCQAATDLGPFRAIRVDALERLEMKNPGYGWTVEMQIKAAQHGLRVVEVPVRYRKRIGRSKITGSLVASVRAGATILWTLFRSW